MRHSISSVAETNWLQMMAAAKPKPSPSAKTSKRFQTFDSGSPNSISSQQSPQTTLETPESLGANTIVEQFDPQRTGSWSTGSLSNGVADPKRSLGRSGYASGEPAVTSSKSTNTAKQSLEQLGSQNSASNDPGSIVNVLV